jgi:hypothetical protein
MRNILWKGNFFYEENFVFLFYQCNSCSSYLQVLFLQNNQLTVWSPLAPPPTHTQQALADNSWSCGCTFVRELQELTRTTRVRDAGRLQCVEFNFMGQEAVRVNIGTNTSCVNSLAVSSLPADGVGIASGGNSGT